MLNVMVCKFKKKETSPFEQGIIINEEKLIIDMTGQVVKSPVWDYQVVPSLGTMVVHED